MRGKGPARDLVKERAWRETMRRWKESGESVRAFCRREGLQEATFYAWRRELTRRRQERQAARAKRMEAEPSVLLPSPPSALRRPKTSAPRQLKTSAAHRPKSSAPRQPVRFLPVHVTAAGPAQELGGVEILLKAGHLLRVRPGFDRRTLAEVLAVLEESPC